LGDGGWGSALNFARQLPNALSGIPEPRNTPADSTRYGATPHGALSVSDLATKLRCPLCFKTLDAISAVDSDNKGSWYLKTAGPFSVEKFADGSYSVLLTLNFFEEDRSLQTTPVMSFNARHATTGKALEADLGVLWQETVYGETEDGILFAECKSYNEFKRKDFDRMSECFSVSPEPDIQPDHRLGLVGHLITRRTICGCYPRLRRSSGALRTIGAGYGMLPMISRGDAVEIAHAVTIGAAASPRRRVYPRKAGPKAACQHTLLCDAACRL
jgi:hypothetical protein